LGWLREKLSKWRPVEVNREPQRVAYCTWA
jgi:hypothetical protein